MSGYPRFKPPTCHRCRYCASGGAIWIKVAKGRDGAPEASCLHVPLCHPPPRFLINPTWLWATCPNVSSTLCLAISSVSRCVRTFCAAVRAPPSKIVPARSGPMVQMRLGKESKFARVRLRAGIIVRRPIDQQKQKQIVKNQRLFGRSRLPTSVDRQRLEAFTIRVMETN
jgi:hypothetical protein